ncbi:SsgA family sporulation/cell division regulator [Sphaerimonospora mesophila]|uniref:SsgA family sporulation/cell division regulator n=1 Tax=Sphaerimonospora mesophila TaxID=37483 RepID=UPI0006E30AC1
MSHFTISDSILLFMDDIPLTGFLHYDSTDPHVVRLNVPGLTDEVDVLRDSLCAGQNAPIDDWYIEIRPDAEYPGYVRITLWTARSEPLVLLTEREPLGKILARTFQVVP